MLTRSGQTAQHEDAILIFAENAPTLFARVRRLSRTAREEHGRIRNLFLLFSIE
jgi:hypothetical protein